MMKERANDHETEERQDDDMPAEWLLAEEAAEQEDQGWVIGYLFCDEEFCSGH
jgi:carotenoid cleavage dioxygenase-like enzyme